uniref:Putative p-type atpase n=1 Tax=Anopheles darlingi TaxID=43151 RepID=A0A2M4DMU9_ANODA
MFVLYLCFLLLVSHFPLLFVLSSSLYFSLSLSLFTSLCIFSSIPLVFPCPCVSVSMFILLGQTNCCRLTETARLLRNVRRVFTGRSHATENKELELKREYLAGRHHYFCPVFAAFSLSVLFL